MQDTGMQDENIQLLGDEGLRAGGQPPMKLGYIYFSIFFCSTVSPVKSRFFNHMSFSSTEKPFSMSLSLKDCLF